MKNPTNIQSIIERVLFVETSWLYLPYTLNSASAFTVLKCGASEDTSQAYVPSVFRSLRFK